MWVNQGNELGEAIEFDSSPPLKFARFKTRNEWLECVPGHIRQLHQRAEYFLQKGTVYEIRGKIPSDYGRRVGVAWYTHEDMQELPLIAGKPWPGKLNELGGFMLLGRFRL